MRNALFILGVQDSNKARVRSMGADGSVDYLLSGNIDLFADLKDPSLAIQVVTLGGMQPVAPRVRNPHVIFNCISDADTNRRALALAEASARALGVPIINAPEKVLCTRRDEVANALANVPGLQVPATIRFCPQSQREILERLENGPVRYPALLRKAGTHGGVSMLLLRSRDDAGLLDQVACDGTEYYLTQFVDFRSADGYYRKMRIVMVDGIAYARHRLVGEDWNMHASARTTTMKAHPELFAEEEAFLDAFTTDYRPRWQPAFQAMHERLGLDYFSIDCAQTASGDLLLFEANASGNALRQADIDKIPYLRRHLAVLKTAVITMLMQRH